MLKIVYIFSLACVLVSLTFDIFYNIDLRTFLIRDNFETLPESIEDLDTNNHILYNLELMDNSKKTNKLIINVNV